MNEPLANAHKRRLTDSSIRLWMPETAIGVAYVGSSEAERFNGIILCRGREAGRLRLLMSSVCARSVTWSAFTANDY